MSLRFRGIQLPNQDAIRWNTLILSDVPIINKRALTLAFKGPKMDFTRVLLCPVSALNFFVMSTVHSCG